MDEDLSGCRKRKCPESCPGYDWYAPSDIKYCRHQIIWLCSNLLLLLSGSWPSDHKETGYTGHKGKSARGAYFETPVQIAAELRYRLRRAGKDGRALLLVYSIDKPERFKVMADIARERGIDINRLSSKIETAMKYISGRWRKKMSLTAWRKQRVYRKVVKKYGLTLSQV